jgi:hypothetical protein
MTQFHSPEELMLRVNEVHGPLIFRGPQFGNQTECIQSKSRCVSQHAGRQMRTVYVMVKQYLYRPGQALRAVGD